MHAMLIRARSHKMKCTGCAGRIQKGEELVAHLKEGKTVCGYCLKCKKGRQEMNSLRMSRSKETLESMAR